MFLSSKNLPRLMKSAYKGPGLRIGMVGGGLYLAQPNNWEVLLSKNGLCNKVKSTVIELYGQFPKPAQVIQIRKGEKAYQVPQSPLIQERLSAAGHGAVSTKVILYLRGEYYWLFQAEDGEIAMIRKEHLELIDCTEIDYDIEGEPVGPSYQDIREGIFYRNGTGILYIHSVLPPALPLVEAMKKINFEEDGL